MAKDSMFTKVNPFSSPMAKARKSKTVKLPQPARSKRQTDPVAQRSTAPVRKKFTAVR